MIQSRYLTGNYSLGSPLMDISASGAGRARWRTRRRRDRRSSRVGDPLWIGCTEIPCFVFYAARNICIKIFSVVARTAHSSVFALPGHPSLHGADFYRRVHQPSTISKSLDIYTKVAPSGSISHASSQYFLFAQKHPQPPQKSCN